MSRVKDETGNKYGSLTVLKRNGSMGGKACWLCQCECGRVKTVTGDNLRQGKAVSCGECEIKKDRCSEVGKNNCIDLTGLIFGRLTVIKRVNKPEYVKKGAYWECLCTCGNTAIAETSNLKTGKGCSCGCLKSKGEEKISEILKKYQVNFKQQYTEDRLRFSKTGYLQRYDFALFDEENNLKCFIEYNGEQHYKFYSNTKSWNSKENFYKTRQRDLEKRQNCKKFKIKLYEISYKNFDNLEKIVYNIIVKNKCNCRLF